MLGVSRRLCHAVYKDLGLEYSLSKEKELHLQAVIRAMQEYSSKDYALYKMRILDLYELTRISELFDVNSFEIIRSCEVMRCYARSLLDVNGYYIGYELDFLRMREKYGKIFKPMENIIEIKITKDFAVKIRG
ncbi:MAG: hypothetical protein IJE43_19700 [Alphaproteobacteria bacterium]|nr:hypothetical protein [Alphaproteobacteria bacterium]